MFAAFHVAGDAYIRRRQQVRNSRVLGQRVESTGFISSYGKFITQGATVETGTLLRAKLIFGSSLARFSPTAEKCSLSMFAFSFCDHFQYIRLNSSNAKQTDQGAF